MRVALDNQLVTYKIYSDKLLVAGKVSGKITFKQVKQHFYTLMHDPDYKEEMNRLYCLDDCTDLDGTMEEVMDITNFLIDPDIVRTRARTAVLIPETRVKLKRYVEGLFIAVSQSRIEHRVYSVSEAERAFEFLGISKNFKDLDRLTSFQTCYSQRSCSISE
jgi:hypothetical protein